MNLRKTVEETYKSLKINTISMYIHVQRKHEQKSNNTTNGLKQIDFLQNGQKGAHNTFLHTFYHYYPYRLFHYLTKFHPLVSH